MYIFMTARWIKLSFSLLVQGFSCRVHRLLPDGSTYTSKAANEKYTFVTCKFGPRHISVIPKGKNVIMRKLINVTNHSFMS